jgi:Rrf2 family protein
MLAIALNPNNDGVFQKDISSSQNISVKYLDHIIRGLKAADLIKNVRGKKSGYVLTREPSEITIFDIHNAFENGICVIDCVSLDFKCDQAEKCQSQAFWKDLNDIILTHFKSTTLLNLLDQEI